MGCHGSSRDTKQAALVIDPDLLPIPNTRLGMKKKELVLVRPGDYTAAELRLAIAEQRLYVIPPAVSPAQLRAQGIEDILRYVGRIDACASDKYRAHIADAWKEVLHTPSLTDLFFLTRYARQRNMPNWYRVNAIVFWLREHEVYNKAFPAMKLHCMMEASNTRTPAYAGAMKYYPDNATGKSILACFDAQTGENLAINQCRQ